MLPAASRTRSQAVRSSSRVLCVPCSLPYVFSHYRFRYQLEDIELAKLCCSYTALVLESDTMNSKQRTTLCDIFTKPVPKSIEWDRIESLFMALGAQCIEGSGSRVRFVLKDVVGTFHRPHPDKEAKPYQVRDARTFLEQAGVKP